MVGPQTNQEALKPDYLYFATSTTGYVGGAVFYALASAPGQIKSDLSLASSIIGYSFPEPSNHDLVALKVIYQSGDTLMFNARRSEFKFSEVPAHGPEPGPLMFDGIGIVDAKNLAFKYKASDGNITVFNTITGTTEILSAQFMGNFVDIQGGLKLKPNPVSSNSNCHKWEDAIGTYTAYRLWW